MLKPLLRYLETAAEQFIAWAGPPDYLSIIKPPNATYRTYTTEFDETIDAATLLARFDQNVETQQTQINTHLAVEPAVHTLMMETLRANCSALTRGLERAFSPEERNDTAVTLLFDQSGSLRGTNYLAIADVAEALADALTDARVATDVLSFTTVRWKGGRSREKWLKDGRPPPPGRLNDLLHVVHLDASGGPRPGPHRFPAMRRERLLKENIDGEALEWAHARLLANPRRRKVLIVVSDGAPVDDSTLTCNWASLLYDHVKEVSARITTSTVVLGGIGIEHDVHEFYPVGVKVKPIAQLADVAPAFIEKMIAAANR